MTINKKIINEQNIPMVNIIQKAEELDLPVSDCVINNFFDNSNDPLYYRIEYCIENCKFKCKYGKLYKKV